MVVIRGTNRTVEEWSSNFDIGCDSIFEGNGLIPRNENWEIKVNHMGFDIAATRVIKLLYEYLSQASNLDNTTKKHCGSQVTQEVPEFQTLLEPDWIVNLRPLSMLLLLPKQLLFLRKELNLTIAFSILLTAMT